MTTITRIRTDWISRYHVQADADAPVLDCFVIELPPYVTGSALSVRLRDGKTMDYLLQDAIADLAMLQKQPFKPVLPSTVFVPFGVITARCFAEVAHEQELRMMTYLGGVEDKGHPDHDERVRYLSRAADLLGMCGPIEPKQYGAFPPIRH